MGDPRLGQEIVIVWGFIIYPENKSIQDITERI